MLSVPEEHNANHSIYYRKTHSAYFNESTEAHKKNNQLYLIDTFRTSIAQLFEINEFIRNFRTRNEADGSERSLVSDLCLHVGELKAFQAINSGANKDNGDAETSNDSNGKNYFPEFNCLYLSPTNYWSNDYSSFLNDDNLMKTINHLNDLQMNHIDKQDNTDLRVSAYNFIGTFYVSIMNFFGRIDLSSNTIIEKVNSTRLSDILFGVSWNSMLSLLKDDSTLVKRASNSKVRMLL